MIFWNQEQDLKLGIEGKTEVWTTAILDYGKIW